MRQYHRENPFHRIEQWNGSYFRHAELWEVGTYLLVQHHAGEPICETLRRWCNLIESSEETKDILEQEKLRRCIPAEIPAPNPVPDLDTFLNNSDIDMDMGNSGMDDNLMDEEDDGDDIDDGVEDFDNIIPYITTAGAGAGVSASAG